MKNMFDDIVIPTPSSVIVNKDNLIISNNRLVKASLITKELTAPEWLIKGVIPSDGLLEFIGASGSYKSFIVLDLMFCISAGIDYHGKKAKKGVVVYIAG